MEPHGRAAQNHRQNLRSLLQTKIENMVSRDSAPLYYYYYYYYSGY